MLQSPPLSKVYGHGHIKKFWLMQNQKESESKALVASSSASPSRYGSNSAGLGHENKQGHQFCLGNATSRSLSSPSGVAVRPSGLGPACFNMPTLARHASLATCAESLSPPLYTDQLRSPLRPSSPTSTSLSISKDDKFSSEDDDYHGANSLCRGSTSTTQCDSPCAIGNHIAGEAVCSYISTSKGVFDNIVHDHFSLGKECRQDDGCPQEELDYVETSNNAGFRMHTLKPRRRSLEIFSNLESNSPFAVPFQLPQKYFLKTEDPVNKVSGGQFQGENGPSLVESLLDCGPAESEHIESICFSAREASKELHHISDNGLRTCSMCGTSKTPLWRSGPQGPKSLCNACGIRFKKAKRSSCEGSVSALPSPQFMKNSLKPAKRKQDIPSANSEAHITRPLVSGSPMAGVTNQVAKKRRWSKLIKKGEYAQKCEVTGSSGESSLTWSLHSPTAVSSPSVAQFERLSIDEKVTVSDMVAGKDEEEAAMLLMYMSCGLVFG